MEPIEPTEPLSPQVIRRQLLALSFIGCGLLALGVAFYLILSHPPSASTPDFSTIPAEVNYPAPKLTLTTLSGEPVSLSDYLGQVVLVNLWATWCPPCRAEMPALQTFYSQYSADGFVLVAIDQGETAEQVIPFVEEFELTFPIWLDTGSEAGRVFKTMSLPSSYVIDRNGQVRLMWIGAISEATLEKFVPRIIKE